MFSSVRCDLLCAVVCACGLAFCGCSDSDAQQQLDRASDAVQTSLNIWQGGGHADTLRSLPHPIQFYDDDWRHSARLVDFQLVQTYFEASDGTPRCAVVLNVQYGDDAPQQVQVTYQVVLKEDQFVIARDPMS